MKKLFVLHIVFLAIGFSVRAQIPDTSAVDNPLKRTIPKLEVPSAEQDTTAQPMEEESEPIVVEPWTERNSPGSHIITNDSLIRWQIWPNWGDYQAYRRDAISFRQGTNGRIDAYHINGYGPYEQQIEMEGISLNNPITGLPNYNLVPHRKIAEVEEFFAGNYYSDIRLRDYYITRPISYLNYDEAEGEFRNLEFMVAQNFTARTNVEASFWDRRGGAYYPNSKIVGSQVVGRVYHHLNEQFLIRGFYLRNQLSNDEPFGYNVGDPLAFIFDEFGSSPISSTGNSEFTRWDLAAGIYHRPDTASDESGGLEIALTKNKKDLYHPGDTLSWDVRTLKGELFKSLDWKKFEIRGEVEGQHHLAEDFSVISQTNWGTFQTQAIAAYNFTDHTQVYGKAKWNYRSDDKSGYDINSGLDTRLFDRMNMGASVSRFSRVPTMQAMYWEGASYRGNTALENESGISVSGNIDIELFETITLGASGRFKTSENSTFLTSDSTFSNSQKVDQIFGMAYARFENHLFELESSGTLQEFLYENVNASEAALNHQDQIIWLRNSAFIKGYVFDRAAYLKIGFKTLFSPLYYSARTFNTELEFWQGNSIHMELPAFFRLDGEISARVRGIMVLIRWENALDGIGQSGYFEAAGFPMPPRRLIIGIRAQFRN